ncbi:MAG: DNA repair and recombination protein RadB [Candidatus Pacearchaeota archaeon]|nr:DNA repair and recombination protein RadB [Candidatus Pacearchaeota archaeon]
MKTEKISTGSYDLNTWLYGGYERDIITMIAGPPGCGKTNFVILASCSQAKKGNKVIFVDTEGGFSVERVKQIMGAENAENALKNIFLLKPTSFEEQKKDFLKLLNFVKKEDIGLIVIDGMAMLYRLETGEAHNLKNDEALAEISRKQNIPIIITNQVYSEFLSEEDLKKGIERGTNLVGGDLFKYWSKCIIELKNPDGKRTAILLKHRNMPQKEMGFIIKNEGVFRKRWL